MTHSITRYTGLLLTVLTASFCACKKSNDPVSGGSVNAGTYAGGALQLSDDPFTKIGCVTNPLATVNTISNKATVVVTGDNGFTREYTGTFDEQQGMTYITLTRQSKPSDKVVGGNVVISSNKLTFSIDVSNESITAKTTPTGTQTATISGKLKILGVDMLRR